jgi:hypothetical protein
MDKSLFKSPPEVEKTSLSDTLERYKRIVTKQNGEERLKKTASLG